MSDSTANAREPSMEDILASIRRIIDEEDTRDGASSGNLSRDEDGSESGEVPVMAAATPDGAADRPQAVSEEHEAGSDDTIFPERDSLFWSRATGRGGPSADKTDHDGAGDHDDVSVSPESREQSERPASRGTDIFLRAQNKLDSSGRQSARERMQDLAAQAGSRTEQQKTVSVDEASGMLEDSAGSMPDHDISDMQDLAGAEAEIFELTDALDRVETEADRDFEAAGLDNPDAPEADDAEPEENPYHAAFDVPDAVVPDLPNMIVPDASEQDQETLDAPSEDEAVASESDEVLDLTMPFVEDETARSADDDAISEESKMLEPVFAVEELAEIEPAETAMDDHQHPAETTTDSFDDEEQAVDFMAAAAVMPDESVEEEVPDALPDEMISVVETADRDESEDETIGFDDAFSASDVYHDDPPELDDDYSASLDAPEPAAVEDEPVMQASPDHEMEKVGGMVREAMERDRVDYTDPAALVSMTSEEISARALASLAEVEGEAGRRVYGSLKISDGGGETDSIEGMVRGMLKPMLREWLDDNLPNMVESMVRGEVERISAKSRKYSRSSDD